MKKLNLWAVLMLVLSFSIVPVQAQEMQLLKSLKEVIMKGSMDGDNVVMVYGLADSWEDMKNLTKNSIKKNDFVDLGDLVYTEGNSYDEYEQVDDFSDAAQRGIDWTADQAKLTNKSFKNIFKRSWKSLKKIPTSYKINFENAKDSYYNTANPLAATVKYTGWALYAQLNGAYYLIIETPVMVAAGILQTVYHGAATILSIPVSILSQTLRIAGQSAWIVIRFVGMNIASLAAGTYSVISTSVASAITLTLAGGIAVFKGTKFLLSAPSKLLKPVTFKLQTELSFDQQEEVAQKMLNFLQSQTEFELDDFSINKYSAEFNLVSNQKDIVKIKVKVEAKKVVIEAISNRRYLKQIKKELDLTNKEAKKYILEKFENLITLSSIAQI